MPSFTDTIPLFAIYAGCASFLLAVLLVLTKQWHGRATMDSSEGVQKVHLAPTPRVGGVAIMVGVLVGNHYVHPETQALLWPLIVAGIPAFAFGLLEDLTKQVSVRTRLLATMACGVMGWLITGESLTHLNVPGIDWLLSFTIVSVLFTAFAVGGVANAINIIDGFNGLAAGTVIIILMAFGAIATSMGDSDLALTSLVLTGAVAGFALVNWPFGKIFLGDGGAYFAGFAIAWIAVLLVSRHPEVSPWAPLLVCGYPILEVLFSIVRRKRRDLSPGDPDRLHLHSLIKRRLVRFLLPTAGRLIRNSATGGLMWLAALLPATIAVAWSDDTAALASGLVLCAGVYSFIYARLTQFRWSLPASPRFALGMRKFLPAETQPQARQLFDSNEESSDVDDRSRARFRIAVVANTAWYLFNFRLNLMLALKAQGHSVIAVGPESSYSKRIRDAGIEFKNVEISGGGVNILTEFKSVAAIWRLLRTERVGLVLSYTPKGNLYAALACITLNRHFVPNVSGLGRAFIRNTPITYLARALYRVTLRSAQHVFFQNNEDMSKFVADGLVPEEKAERLPGSGVDLDRFSSDRPTETRDHEVVFLLVARMLWDKGVGEYVEAARHVRSLHPNARFQLLGFLDVANPSAVSSAQMNQWIEEGVIEYLGSTDDVRSYLQRADCIVLPSKYREGVPRTLLEGAASGRPVITTDASGCRDTVIDNVTGYLCRPADAKDLAEKMLRLIDLSPEQRWEMGAAGRRHVEQSFDERLVLRRYLDVVQTVVAFGKYSHLTSAAARGTTASGTQAGARQWIDSSKHIRPNESHTGIPTGHGDALATLEAAPTAFNRDQVKEPA